MSSLEINKVLSQMRSMAAELERPAQTPAAEPAGQSFGEVMKTGFDKVNELSAASSAATAAFERGDPSANVAEVMVAMQKASLSFQAMTEVRNRLVSAYQDVMNMPV